MSLYDDMDAIKQKSEQVAGWSSGIKLLQSQLQLKKAVQTQVIYVFILKDHCISFPNLRISFMELYANIPIACHICYSLL